MQTYDVGKQLYPNLPQHTDNSNGKGGDNNSNPQSTQHAGSSTPPPVTVVTEVTALKGAGAAPTAGDTAIVVTASSSPAVVTKGVFSPPPDSIVVAEAVAPPTVLIPFVVTPPTISLISTGAGNHVGPVMSADGQYVTYDPDGAIFLFNRQTGATITIASPSGGLTYSAPTISSDGRFVVYQRSDGIVFLYNNNAADAANYRHTTQLVAGTSPAISGDGAKIVVEQAGNIDLFDQQGNPITTISAGNVGSSGAVWKPAISGDGHLLALWSSDAATAGGSGKFVTIDLATGSVTTVATTSTGAGTTAPSISADGRYIVYQSTAAGGHSEIHLYDANTGQVVFSTASVTGASYNPVISPDGHYIIFASDARLTPDDTNAMADTYVVDVTDPSQPVFRLVSALADGTQGDGASNLGASISAGGLYVAFGSSASNSSMEASRPQLRRRASRYSAVSFEAGDPA